ncbi:MAG: hypothetical protein QOI15_1985 [Pseudonocardiales bacterium]|nr:hypothetical protein [Pseudonocardiales bacterium]
MRGAHHRPSVRKNRIIRTLVPIGTVAATAASFLAFAVGAGAATTWFVAPASAGGSASGSCGTAALPCTTVSIVIAKPAFVSGDTINVAAGTYTDRPLFGAKAAVVQGAGAATTVFDGSNVGFAIGTTLPATATLVLKDMTLTRGSTATGGALAIGGGQIVTTNVNLTNSKAAFGAGAYVAQGASLAMNGGSITGNVATATAALSGAGGAVYVAGRVGTTTAAGQLTLNNVTVSNNSALGSNQVAAGNGGAIFNAGTATITGSTFNANQAVQSTNANARRGQGGAIFNGANDTDDLPSLTISNTTITGGLASGSFNSSSGGAIANSESFGGLAGAVLNANKLTLTGNAALLGGGIYNGGTANVTGGTIQSSAAVSGAGVYQSPIVTPAAIRPVSTFDGTSFLNNVANGLTLANFGNGGAIFNQATMTVRNATFTGNQAVAASAASTVTGWGGAIYNGPYATNDLPTLAISDSQINGGGVTSNAVIGGGIANVGNVFGFAGATNGQLAATRVTFSKNAAQVAGGAYTGGATTITGSTFDQNNATHASVGFGGGLYASKSPTTGPNPVVTIDSTAFTANTATVLGGGIALGFGTNLELRNGSSVDHNSSAVNAGGIYSSGALTVRNSSVSNNDAAFQGGGIYSGSNVAAEAPALTLVNATVDGNDAPNVGGGIVTTANATLVATGGEINGNSATGAGGIYVGDNAPASFDGTQFVGNTATASSGGAVFNSGTLTLTHALLSSNHAIHTTGNVGLGGAIYSGSNNANVATKLTVNASTISGNDAWAGAALVTFSPGNGSTNVTAIDRSTIHGNTNGTNVGSVEQFHPLSITNSTITDNTSAAGSTAGLYMIDPSTVRVAGDIFSNNSGGSCSSAPIDGGYNLADQADASCGFTPANHDVSAAPQLGPLGSNGGAAPTRLPGPTSPALDKIPANTVTGITNAVTGGAVTLCAAGALDQRDVTRPQGAKCDIGAVEAAQIAPTVSGPNSVDYSIGNMGTAVTFTTTGSPQPTLSKTGALPPGVTFVDNGDGTATLSGTPTAGPGGHYVITVIATNEAGTATKSFDLVLHQAPTLGGPASATYTVGAAGVAQMFTATGFPPAAITTTSTLPSGVTLVDNGDGTATLSGTPAAGTGGVYTIVIKAANDTPPDSTLTFVLTVNEAPTVAGPSSATFTVGTNGNSGGFTTTGQPVPTLSASGLPAGLSLVSTGSGTAKITGTPANGTGGEYDATVTATNGVGSDASTTVHVVVKEAPEITGPAAARFVTGTSSTIGFSADGYPQATLTKSGTLPPGVTFVDNGNGTATLAGSAATGSDGTYNITITASNGVNPDAVLHLVLTVVPPVAITTTSLPNAAIGTAYGAQIIATGGQPAYTFTKIGGALPAGLSLASDGSVTGTATGPTGTYSFTVKVVDSASPSQSATKVITITVVKGTSTLTVQPVLLQTQRNPLGIKVTIGRVSATLTGGTLNTPIGGATIVFKAGTATVCTGVTNASGVVNCTMTVANTVKVIAKLGVTATFAGNALWLPSSGTAGLIAVN